MTGPDRRILLALDRRRGLDSDGLRRATRLGATTVNVSVGKLTRMRLVVEGEAGQFRLTAHGKRTVKELRAGP